jgi:patatin-like phospholipase/acyl hydrolase
MAPYRVLSLDGGGIRGLVTAVLLQRLNTHSSITGFLDDVDLIAGTSTGGIIALALAHGQTLAEIRDLYAKKGRDIFDDSVIDDVLDLGRIAGAEYDNKNLARELKRVFGETTLAGLKRRVLIACFDLDNGDDPDPKKAKGATERSWKPKLFHNYPGKDSDGPRLARDVALYTSAAPTYFPSVDGFIDGGVYANNPAMCALAQTQDRRIGKVPPLEDVVLLSVGTGISRVYIKGKTLDWGYARWAKPLVSLMMDGVSGIADFQCEQILGDHYHRIAPCFPAGTSVPMDAVNRIEYMEEFAHGVRLESTVRWIAAHWDG